MNRTTVGEIEPPRSLTQLLERIEAEARQCRPLSIEKIMGEAGSKTFGPFLIVAGLVAVSPASGLPGVPTSVGLSVVLISAQVLMGRQRFWLPKWMLRRTVSAATMDKTLKLMRPAAAMLDRLFRPRFAMVVGPKGSFVVAISCLFIAIAMPPMELIPFASTIAGMALSAFGLALVVHDGLVALIAMLLTVGAAGLLINVAS